MSRPRVVTGTDDRGRPVTAWADPEPDISRAYGHMEPALAETVHRRRATPEELEAARAREAEPDHLTNDNVRSAPFGATTPPPSRASAERMQVSRQRGADRRVELVAAAKRTPGQRHWNGHAAAAAAEPEEETTVTEISTESPADVPVVPPAPVGGLHELAVAAEAARGAHDTYEAARTAWDVAREALARAYGEVEWIVEPSEPVLHVTVTPTVRSVPAYVPPTSVEEVVPRREAPAKRRGQPGRHHSTAGEPAAKAARAERVMASMARHHNDVVAVAAELGMKRNAVTMVAKHARARQAAQQAQA